MSKGSFKKQLRERIDVNKLYKTNEDLLHIIGLSQENYRIIQKTGSNLKVLNLLNGKTCDIRY